MGVSRRARSKWARSQLLGALLEALLACLEDLECQEDPDQECQEANTTRDVFASTCPATCPRCHQQDLDQDIQQDLVQDIQALDLEALDLDLVPHLFLPLVAMEQVGNSAQSLLLLFLSLSANFIPLLLSPPH